MLVGEGKVDYDTWKYAAFSQWSALQWLNLLGTYFHISRFDM